MRTAVALALVCLGAWGCGAQPTPSGVAHAYLERVSRDPIGTLPLLSDAFHGRHGLRHTLPGSSQTLLTRAVAPLPSEPAARRRELSAARLGWLIVQAQESVRAHAGFLALEPIDETITGDRASVAVRVRLAEAPGFVQRFTLVRAGVGAPWQIDAIEQEGVTARNVPQAFALAPSVALLRKAAAWQGGPAGP